MHADIPSKTAVLVHLQVQAYYFHFVVRTFFQTAGAAGAQHNAAITSSM